MKFFSKTQIQALLFTDVFKTVFNNYINIAKVFSSNLTTKLIKHIKINNHVIKLIDNPELYYRQIFRIELIKLKMLKMYIEINLVNNLIKH